MDEAAVAYMKADLSPLLVAIEQSRKCVERNPIPARPRQLGNALAGCGQLDEATAEYRKTIKLRPDYAPAHNNLANVLITQHRADEAIAEYRKAIALNPNYADACNNLGTLFAGRGEIDAAVAQFRRAVQIAPAFATPRQSGHGAEPTGEDRRGDGSSARAGAASAQRCPRRKPVGLGDGDAAGADGANAKEAVELAEWAVELSHAREPVPLKTLAAA